MNVNFGLFPPMAEPSPSREKGPRQQKGLARKRALSLRALADLERWLAEPASVAAA
jgi:methylenetetrahydrofolate--tRNA-(uracil-5-)-methyltransferase